MNVTDYGGYFRIGVGEDMSSATSFTLDFITPSGTLVSKPGTLGDAAANGMAAGQYVNYQVEQGFLTEDGDWTVKLIVNYPTKSRSTNVIPFSVGD